MAEAGSETFTLNIKAPGDQRFTVTVPASSTVEQLKEEIAKAKEDFPVDQQRLIFSGRVLKNEDPISKYGIKAGVAIHLVKGARPAGAASTSSTPAARNSSEAAGVPSNFAAGQQVMGNPLAPLMNAQYAGALGGFNPFAQMGVNTNDPNYMQNMMNNPEVQAQMNRLLQDPAVLDQIIASSPQLQQMGPYARQIMQSEHFRNMITNPQAMQQAMQMMGGMGGMGAGAGAAPFPPPGAFGAAQGQQGAGTDSAAATGAGAGPAGSPPPAFNSLAMFGGGAAGAGGQQPDLGAALAQMQQLQSIFGGFGGAGVGAGVAGAAGGPQQSPEERYAAELEQLRGMGFTNATRNVRALLASGGFVDSAVAWLLENPE
ncbi:ubiquilin [Rhodotorula toruloides]|uniref:Ubiquilin n=1 Tax=Rhodotorula toruloides TaxID=5286 RepID=A0A511K9V9_RHOTO|nr:ubiquilin [Rhodotorula toruloides]